MNTKYKTTFLLVNKTLKKRFVFTFWIALLTALVSSGCQTQSDSGKHFKLSEGLSWEYTWSYTIEAWEMDAGVIKNTNTHDSGSFQIELGKAIKIQGKTLFQLSLKGEDSTQDQRKVFHPRWKYIGFDHNTFWGSTDAQTLQIIFNLDQPWVGGGFFTTFSDLDLMKHEHGNIHLPGLSGALEVIQKDTNPKHCLDIKQQKVCGQANNPKQAEFEYYQFPQGPVGYYFKDQISICGAEFCSGENMTFQITPKATTPPQSLI